MSSAAAATAKSTRGPKTRGTEWWEPPPDTPLNLAIPYVVSLVDDGLSLAQSRVLACITNLKAGAKREEQATGGRKEPRFVCRPGGYTRIAKNTGLCRKTVYNAIQALIAKGVVSVWKRETKGSQILRTYYFALHYGDILPMWRSNERFFHTDNKSSVVVRKRSKQIMTVEDGIEWQLSAARAPKRGSGRGLQEVREAVEPRETSFSDVPMSGAPAPLEINDEDLAAVHMELLRWTGASCLKDAIDVIADARAEANRMGYAEQGYGGPLPVLTVVEMIQEAAAGYKPSRHYPRPTPGWFLGGSIRREVAKLLKFEWEQKQG